MTQKCKDNFPWQSTLCGAFMVAAGVGLALIDKSNTTNILVGGLVATGGLGMVGTPLNDLREACRQSRKASIA